METIAYLHAALLYEESIANCQEPQPSVQKTVQPASRQTKIVRRPEVRSGYDSGCPMIPVVS
ncbi:MAG: hypothetical protein HC769_13355 [Cyanobacteria bacterium CRU_2_1]|nr:hypothetical protein [Cyanobacteria bacterium RU_5_0]NJR59736.1 hypothetical protein [Cyanobacteria bacterium CRU_2_1]